MKPYLIIHMMQSVDGRIDCAMTEEIDPSDAYYESLDKLGCPSQIMGRVTMQMHYAAPEPFIAHGTKPIGRRDIHKAVNSDCYTVALDTMGRLTWASAECDGKPLIVLTSEDCAEEYHETLTRQGISWIAVGHGGIDLRSAFEALGDVFGIERIAGTGGGRINGSLLAEGLVDEVSIMIGPGIDGRSGMAAVFDGIEDIHRPATLLKLNSVERVNDDVWLRYAVKK